MSNGLNRSPKAMELLNDLCAFVLLTVIVLRARRADEFNFHNLQSGEAFVGDYRRYDMTE